MSDKVRVLVVDDSNTARQRMIEVLAADSGIEIVGEASDGRSAIDLCERLRPDVITMDMVMPGLDGVAATEHIMAYRPTPILIVSASTNRGQILSTYDALAAGAVDVLEKPDGVSDDLDWARGFVATVKLVSRIRVITHPRARLDGPRPKSPSPPSPSPSQRPRLIAIGASTGGPGAILSVLRDLPASFPVPILLVIHIAEPFGRAMAGWLDSQASLTVRYACAGEPVPDHGCVLMAPPGHHLVVGEQRLQLSDGPELHSCKPSVDVLFHSIAESVGPAAVGCLLTGMGRDGAAGMLAMRSAGAFTIAQDQATSVIFGMPAEAIRLGGATEVLGIHELSARLCAVTSAAELER